MGGGGARQKLIHVYKYLMGEAGREVRNKVPDSLSGAKNEVTRGNGHKPK